MLDYPRTAVEFLECLERTEELHHWSIAALPSESSYSPQNWRTVFYLTGSDPLKDGMVAFELGGEILITGLQEKDSSGYVIEALYDEDNDFETLELPSSSTHKQRALVCALTRAIPKERLKATAWRNGGKSKIRVAL